MSAVEPESEARERPETRVNERIHPSLLSAMHLALLAEFGARAIYPRLARRTRDTELAQVLERFHQEECEQVERLRALLIALGHKPPKKSRRRSLVGLLLASSGPIGGHRLALRLCFESELTVARWYHEYARYLAQAGERAHARTCEELAVTKQRHAQMLEAWVAH